MELIAKSVRKLVRKHETRNPFALCRALGVKIMYMDLDLALKAYYFTHSRCYRIVLNNSIDEALQRVLVAHELGHHLEHRRYAQVNSFQEFAVYETNIPMEYEANLYAAELLISDEDVTELLAEEASFLQVARALQVPPELLDFKFRMLNAKGYRLTPLYLGQSDFLKKSFPDM